MSECSCHINPPCNYCLEKYECEICHEFKHPDDDGQNGFGDLVVCDECFFDDKNTITPSGAQHGGTEMPEQTMEMAKVSAPVQKPSIGRTVHYAPPQECVGPKSLCLYPAIISQVNEDGTVELATFGPNSLYFQHKVAFAEALAPGFWSWPPRV